MSFDGSEGSEVTLSEASSATSRFQSNNSSQNKGFFIGKDLINDLLDQTDCQGIRIYLGENMMGYYDVYLVGADSDEDDITSKVVNRSIKCPSICGAANELNGN